MHWITNEYIFMHHNATENYVFISVCPNTSYMYIHVPDMFENYVYNTSLQKRF